MDQEFKNTLTLFKVFPTPDDPFGPYTYASLAITKLRVYDLKVHNRKTYSLFDWLGDVGGLMDGLYLLGEILVAGYSATSLESYLASKFIWIRPSKAKDDSQNCENKNSKKQSS